ncbi:MAG: hypothetical protein ACTSYO_08180 [Candidatus Ranarchaeia archaeon]
MLRYEMLFYEPRRVDELAGDEFWEEFDDCYDDYDYYEDDYDDLDDEFLEDD